MQRSKQVQRRRADEAGTSLAETYVPEDVRRHWKLGSLLSWWVFGGVSCWRRTRAIQEEDRDDVPKELISVAEHVEVIGRKLMIDTPGMLTGLQPVDFGFWDRESWSSNI